MSAAEHLQEAIDVGCTRGDEHDHIADHRAEVLNEAADKLDSIAVQAEAKVAEYYGAASGIGPGSADMVREAASTVRGMATGAEVASPAGPTATHAVPVTTTDPIVVRWDRLVMHPNDPDDQDTIVCCLTTDGQPVALVLDEELRQALGASLLDPDASDDHGCMDDVFTASELHEMQQDGEYRMDAEDDAQLDAAVDALHAEQDAGQ